jgi:MFS family permease
MVVTHGIAYATAQGIPREQVVFVFSIMGLISISGRIGAGWLGDHLIKRGRPPVHARRSMIRFSALFMGIGIILLMQADSLLHLWLWAIIFGVGYGSHVPQVAAITGDLFGRKNMGLIVSLMFTAFGLSGMVISVWTGWIHDTTGVYTLAYQVGTALCFLSVILSSLITIPKRQALSE